MSEQRQALGQLGEKLALNRLQELGYRIIRRNYRVKSGEVDIIAEDDGTLVFIEVKTRQAFDYGPPLEAVTLRKQRQLSMVALEYLGEHKLGGRPARFDVVGVSFHRGQALSAASARVEVVQNAFDLCYGI